MASRDVAPKKVLEMMKEATGASEEDICVMLQLCNGDANEATEKLLESEFDTPLSITLSRRSELDLCIACCWCSEPAPQQSR